MPNLTKLNSVDSEIAFESFHRCCGSKVWAQRMTDLRPFQNEEDLLKKADLVWFSLTKADFLEAFAHHPPIGKKSLEEKFKSTAQWSAQEQNGVSNASNSTIDALARGNKEYLDKFGFVFLICATGKSADEMLKSLQLRVKNDIETEIKNACKESSEITKIRLKKLLSESSL